MSYPFSELIPTNIVFILPNPVRGIILYRNDKVFRVSSNSFVANTIEYLTNFNSQSKSPNSSFEYLQPILEFQSSILSHSKWELSRKSPFSN